MTESQFKYYDRLERAAVERLDVLEDALPRECCSVKGCNRSSAIYGISGANERTFFVCARHRPEYRVHERIVSRIRSFPQRDVR
jgi:hypothetical protein